MRLYILCAFLVACTGTIGDESVVEQPETEETSPGGKPSPVGGNHNHKPYCPDIPLEIENEDGSTEIVWVRQPCPGSDDYQSQPGPDPGPFGLPDNR